MSKKSKSKQEEPKFYNIIKYQVLPLYNLTDAYIEQVKVKNTDKQRAVYKVSLDNCSYCLKKVYYNEGDLLFIYSTMEWLYINDIMVPKLIPTVNGQRFVKVDNLIFILTPWIEGIKCSFDNYKHLTESIKNLALMHKSTSNFFPIDGSSKKEEFDNLFISTNSHFNKILTCYNEASKRKDKFSKLFLDKFDESFILAKYATEMACSINENNLKRSICHGDYVNKNIIFENDRIWTIDFDKCCYNYSAQDISYFLRRLLKRTSTNWDIELTENLLTLYNSINPLTYDDVKYILSSLAFPQKYWRTSKDYYNNISKCNKDYFYDTLSKSTGYLTKQWYFINDLEQFFNKYFKFT